MDKWAEKIEQMIDLPRSHILLVVMIVLFTALAMFSVSVQSAELEWKSEPIEEGVLFSSNKSGGKFWVQCETGKGCGWYIKIEEGCIPGNQYRFLINSATRIGFMPAVCYLLGTQGPVIMVTEPRYLGSALQALSLGESFSVAVPKLLKGFETFEVTGQGIEAILKHYSESVKSVKPEGKAI